MEKIINKLKHISESDKLSKEAKESIKNKIDILKNNKTILK